MIYLDLLEEFKNLFSWLLMMNCYITVIFIVIVDAVMEVKHIDSICWDCSIKLKIWST